MNNIEEQNKAIEDIVFMINTHKQNAYRKINEELVSMYYEIGSYLYEKISKEKWGDKTIEVISKAITKRYPELKGFTKRSLYRMKQFYETYKDNTIVSPLVSQISWTNNIIIFSHNSSIEEKEFYIRMCIKNNYSKRELERQINSRYYERYMLSGNKAKESKTALLGEEDSPCTRILDQYSLEFLDLPSNYAEKDLKRSIVENMKDFILEIGKDFSFIGEEYRIQVGDSDYYIDLLFYNRAKSCLVAFELKIGKFIPEYVSKMDFYLEALDRNVKKENENPSVGIILCAAKNDVTVEYALSRTISPTLVSTYSTELINKEALQKKMLEYKKLFEDKEN